MSLMEKMAAIANNVPARAVSPEYAAGVEKMASMALDTMQQMAEYEDTMSKHAEEGLVKLSAEERAEIREWQAVGRGIYQGEQMGKEAGYREGHEDTKAVILNKIAAMYGDEVADGVLAEIYKDAGVTPEDLEADEEAAQIQQDIAQAAAKKLLEQHPNPENITPEEAQEIAQMAQQAGAMGLQQLMEEEAPAEAPAAPAEEPKK